MNGLPQAAALISAVVYIAAAPLELFFFSSPRVRALLHVEADNVAGSDAYAVFTHIDYAVRYWPTGQEGPFNPGSLRRRSGRLCAPLLAAAGHWS